MQLVAESPKMKLLGIIFYGPDLNARHWIEEAKRDGYIVVLHPNRAELYRVPAK